MTVDYIRTMYQYNDWANRRILDTTAQITLEQLHEKSIASFESIFDTLVHTMAGQWIWLSRWQGTSPTAMPNPADFADLTAVQVRWEQVEADTQAFVNGLDESALNRIVNYTNTQGKPNSFPLWQLMLHQVNHATQHRSEIAAILTQLGHSPGGLDLLLYLDQQK